MDRYICVGLLLFCFIQLGDVQDVIDIEKNLNEDDSSAKQRSGTFWIKYTWQANDLGLKNVSNNVECKKWLDYYTALRVHLEQVAATNASGFEVDVNDTTTPEPTRPSATISVLNTTEDAKAIGADVSETGPTHLIITEFADIRVDWAGVCRNDPYILWINSTDDDPSLSTEVLCQLFEEKLTPKPEDIENFVIQLQEEALKNSNITENYGSNTTALGETWLAATRVRRAALDDTEDLHGDVDTVVTDPDADAAPTLIVKGSSVVAQAGANGTNVTVAGGIQASTDIDDPTLVVNWELAELLLLNLSLPAERRLRSRQVGFKLSTVCSDVAPAELEQTGGEGVGAGSLGDLGLDADKYAKQLKNDTAVDKIKDTLSSNQSSLGGSYIHPILQARKYDRFSPPKFFKGQAIEIKFGVYIESMSNFQTTTMDYDMDIYLQMSWRDPRLINNLSLPILIKEEDIRDEIWRPDPYFSNSKESNFQEVTFLNFLMNVLPSGEVYYEIRLKIKPACNLVLCKYPHDKQVCRVRIESFAYPREVVRFKWFTNRTDALSKNDNLRLPELYISEYAPTVCQARRQTGNYSCLQVVFNLGRSVGYYVTSTYIPTSLALMFSWVGVFLPDEFMEGRIALAITVLLTMSTESAGAREHLPSVSYLKAIDIWFGFITAFVFCTLLQTLIVISLDKRSAQLSKWASRPSSEASDAVRKKLLRRSTRLHKVANKLDELCRVLYPLVFVIFLIVYFFVFTKGQQDSCI